MAGEQLIIDRPSQEFLHAVLKHPDLPKLASAPTFEPPEKSTLTLSASPELRGYPLDSISVIDKYLQKCVELGVRPYYGVLLKYSQRMGGSELSGFVPFSSGYLPDFNSIRNNPNKDEVQHHIVQEVMRRVSMGGRAHLLAYEFDIGQLSDLNVDLEMRKKDGYNIRALSMVLASGIRMDRGLGNSSGGDARFVAPTIKLVYNPNRGLVLSSHWDEPLDKHPEVTDWFTNLQAA